RNRRQEGRGTRDGQRHEEGDGADPEVHRDGRGDRREEQHRRDVRDELTENDGDDADGEKGEMRVGRA
ncbi:hypothetical protein COF36_23130, partial [Bacillus pseudomycoides]